MLGAIRAADFTEDRLAHINKAILQAPAADTALLDKTRALEDRLYTIQLALSGDRTIRSRAEPTPPWISQRVQRIVSGHWTSTSAPTQTHRESYRIAGEQFEPVLDDLRTLIEQDVRALEDDLDRAGAPWTPGRLPYWKRQ